MKPNLPLISCICLYFTGYCLAAILTYEETLIRMSQYLSKTFYTRLVDKNKARLWIKDFFFRGHFWKLYCRKGIVSLLHKMYTAINKYQKKISLYNKTKWSLGIIFLYDTKHGCLYNVLLQSLCVQSIVGSERK